MSVRLKGEGGKSITSEGRKTEKGKKNKEEREKAIFSATFALYISMKTPAASLPLYVGLKQPRGSCQRL